MTYDEFFKRVTRGGSVPHGFKPMPWQIRLACGNEADPTKRETLKRGAECKTRLIDIPTGCGKTAGTVLAWVWNRIVLNRQDWPRRLLYCLPMRTLVEQTRDWLKKSVAMRAKIEALWKNRLTADPEIDAQDLFAIPKTLQRCPVKLPAFSKDA